MRSRRSRISFLPEIAQGLRISCVMFGTTLRRSGGIYAIGRARQIYGGIHLLVHIKSGELYPVNFLPLHPYDLQGDMAKGEDAFDWNIYFGFRNVELYKLVIQGNDVMQGAIALERREDHVYIHLIESAPHNRFDKVHI